MGGDGGLLGRGTRVLGRGLAGFITPVFRYAEGTPFHRLNRIVYSPLCLAIAATFIALR